MMLSIIRRLTPKLWLGSVRNRLLSSFLLILLLPGIAIGGFAYKEARNQVDGQLQAAAVTDIKLVSAWIDQYIEAKMDDVNLLSLQNADQAALDAYTRNHEEIEQATVVQTNGTYVYSPSTLKLAAGYKPEQAEFYTQAMQSKGSAVVTEPYTSSETGETVVAIARATADGQSVVAVVLQLEGLKNIVSDITIGTNGFVVVFSGQGEFIVSPPWNMNEEDGSAAGASPGGGLRDAANASPSEADAAMMPAGKASAAGPAGGAGGPASMFTGDSGIMEQVSPDGDQRSLIYITNELTGWKIAGDRSPGEVTRTAAPILNNTIVVISVSTIIGLFLMALIVRSITKPLRALNEMSKTISQGDLSRRVQLKSKDEFGELGARFDQMADSLQTVLWDVGQSANQLAASSEQLSASAEQTTQVTEHIAGTIEQMARGAVNQASLVGECVVTIQEVAGSIDQIVQSAHYAADKTEQVAAKSAEGGQAVQSAVRQMDSISQSVNGLGQVIGHLVDASKEIGQIMAVITDLSEQTNLLSLNASIEAARAGEHGRGFSVVAGEVKKLAEQSAQSAERVASLILAVRKEIGIAQQSMRFATDEVSRGIQVVNTAGSLFADIESSVNEVIRQVSEVSSAAEQIARGANQVVQAIGDISNVSQSAAEGAENVSGSTQQQLAAMQEIASSSDYLTKMAEELQTVVDKFKV